MSLNFRCDQLQLYKTQLTKDLQNKPITLPFEIEDIKHQKQHTKYSARKHCEQKVPTQQVENINQQADEFRTNNIQYAVNGSILGNKYTYCTFITQLWVKSKLLGSLYQKGKGENKRSWQFLGMYGI